MTHECRGAASDLAASHTAAVSCTRKEHVQSHARVASSMEKHRIRHSLPKMKPADLSEFSFGYALTETLIRWRNMGLTAAPVFPSLRAEGQTGGGYDVRLNRVSALPLLLQFKLSDRIQSRRAVEVQRTNMPVPFYRFYISGRRRTAQHSLLLEQEQAGCEVYYVAPAFHRQSELNRFYLGRDVDNRSGWFRPSFIGAFQDTVDHKVGFRLGGPSYVSSEPVEIKGPLVGDDVANHIHEILDARRPEDTFHDLEVLRDRLLTHVPSAARAQYASRELDITRQTANVCSAALGCTLLLAARERDVERART
jgi:hypothetical protein